MARKYRAVIAYRHVFVCYEGPLRNDIKKAEQDLDKAFTSDTHVREEREKFSFNPSGFAKTIDVIGKK